MACAYNARMSAAAASLTDHFLIAMPGMDDPNFVRSVIYIGQHNAEGAMGLVINRTAGFALGDILDELQLKPISAEIASQPVLIGGPIQSERGFVLHGADGRSWDSSVQVATDLVLTTSRDILGAIAENRAPERTLFALGYSGWGAGQLERELMANAWLTVPADRAVMFETAIDQRWSAAIALVGIDASRLSDQIGHA